MIQIKDKSQTFLFVITTTLIITNILLIFQNLNLRTQLSQVKPLQVEQGDVLSEFQAKDLSGKETSIDYKKNNSKRILFFFRTTCGYCKKQMAYWKDLASKTDRQNYKITAITTEIDAQAIKDYMKNYEIEDWEVLRIKSEDARKAKMLVTPITIVVDNKGVVKRVWTGMWQTNDIDSASEYFALNFSETNKTR